ncbi:Ycf51 family protein [Leptothermofonsia sichuanensis E412]|uniref:Ycf51 family protein n=1 Tax=Leptothermofonsia sichuanensis TaxID=2917832 RepID=UPI001CA6E42E|nr:Ycf51 family protein [Leptothermofonsia sichuanensis]QZZ21323.1 Ycf51 family protein [Leptothermofonsia sichuanensis E412]
MSTEQLLTFARWSGYFTLFCAALTGLGWILKWGIRFRLVGVTGFMGVLTGGLFALSLGLYSRPDIPGAVRYWRVFDTGSTQVVITVPNTITESELDATLRQAASKLFSPGRMSQGEEFITIRARTVLHPEPGVTQPLYLGQVKRSLLNREDNTPIVEIFSDKLAQLPKVESDGG